MADAAKVPAAAARRLRNSLFLTSCQVTPSWSSSRVVALSTRLVCSVSNHSNAATGSGNRRSGSRLVTRQACRMSTFGCLLVSVLMNVTAAR